MKKYLLLVVSLFLLSGCVTTQETIKVVEKQNYVLVEPDELYLKDCTMSSPPPKVDYSQMSMDEREDALTKSLLANYKYQQECTLDKRVIQSVLEKNRKLIKAQNEKEAKRVTGLQKE